MTFVQNALQGTFANSAKSSLPLRIGDIEFDEQRGLIRRAGRRLRLGPVEFRLFALLISNPGKPYSRDDLIRLVWPGSSVDIRTVDVTIGRLRKAVTWGWHLDPIRSVYRRGYKFDEGFARRYSDWAALGKKKLRLESKSRDPAGPLRKEAEHRLRT